MKKSAKIILGLAVILIIAVLGYNFWQPKDMFLSDKIEISKEMQECTNDSECTGVMLGCKLQGINKKYKKELILRSSLEFAETQFGFNCSFPSNNSDETTPGVYCMNSKCGTRY